MLKIIIKFIKNKAPIKSHQVPYNQECRPIQNIRPHSKVNVSLPNTSPLKMSLW